ncbi:plasma-membrane choline transporter family protein [Striga asiatica]|uniref:Choline transporter-like protein n=1 Tax=Striga asiatica TaxID=4170 RepID=A0A5A7R3T2_STRAF|nr:plasma-membrane choline transporter family protein [Striga asiatica]
MLPAVQTSSPRHSLSSRNKVQNTIGPGPNFLDKLPCHLFYAHLLLITALIAFLAIRAALFPGPARNFHPRIWYAITLSTTALSGLSALSYQALVNLSPSKTFKTTFWLSPLLTCAYGILLVLIGTPTSLAAGVLTIICSVTQSLYACWASPRFTHATKILSISLAYQPPKTKSAVIISVCASILFSSLLMSGLGNSTTKLEPLFVFLILASLVWTMQIIKNTMQVAVSHVKYMQFACGVEVDFGPVAKATARNSMGSICAGSILVPAVTAARAAGRAVGSVSGDSDEFMFSCAGCCVGASSRAVAYGNRWGFVHVGVYGKGIIRASGDTWEMFGRAGMEDLIDRDLTSSFCFLCGVASGAVCGLVGGVWALFVHGRFATEVSVYAFLVGYFTVREITTFDLSRYVFLNRVAMAWIQASVMAYYVAYAENPQSQQFDDTIPAYIRQLQRSQVQKTIWHANGKEQILLCLFIGLERMIQLKDVLLLVTLDFDATSMVRSKPCPRSQFKYVPGHHIPSTLYSPFLHNLNVKPRIG